MIVDCLENWGQYLFRADLGPAFEFLMSLKPDAEEKVYPLQGEEIFARVMSYDTRPADSAILESHRKYIDIQTVLIGAEGIEWFHVHDLEIMSSYDASRDVAFYRYPGNGAVRVDVTPGLFVMLFPQDAHMPQLMVGDAAAYVKKAVVKVNVELMGAAPGILA